MPGGVAGVSSIAGDPLCRSSPVRPTSLLKISFEFKVVELTPKGAALQQLKDKGYADKFKASGQPIHLIGVEFSKASRNIVGFEVETLADFGG